MQRFLVPEFTEDTRFLQLDKATSHHLLNVLRVARGAKLVVFCDANWEVDAVLCDVKGNLAVLEIIGARRLVQTSPTVHLLIGIPKGPAMDLAVRMATEAGVREIHPMQCQRTVPKGERVDRWRKIIESACQQCGRTELPILHYPTPFIKVLEQHRHFDSRYIAHPTTSHNARPTGTVAIAVGPEGGFTDTEVQQAIELGFSPLTLGPFILRTDTAAAVATAFAVQSAYRQ